MQMSISNQINCLHGSDHLGEYAYTQNQHTIKMFEFPRHGREMDFKARYHRQARPRIHVPRASQRHWHWSFCTGVACEEVEELPHRVPQLGAQVLHYQGTGSGSPG